MAKAVKLSDIAAKIGVSTVTVSKALSGQKGMSDELRDRIVAIPFLSSRSLFLMAVKILPLARSTTPLDCGWYTEAKASLVPMEKQKSLKSWLSNYLPLSTVSSDGTPNQQTMFC